MKGSLIVIFAILLFGGGAYSAFGQSDSMADHVVINEVDINPPGDDSKTISEWIELYNPTNQAVDFGGWSISSTTVLKKTLTLSPGTIIKSGGFLTLSYDKLWFTDVSEVVQLKDANGVVVDQTPSISDVKNDFTSWQRLYDGFDTDSVTDWKFATSTAGSSNGKLSVGSETTAVSVSVSSDKPSYIFGEKAVISGSVSERIFTQKPFFQPAEIKIKILGPNAYEKDITMFPDLFLKYQTTLDLRKVLGIFEGEYTVLVEYAGGIDTASFSVGDEIIIIEEKKAGDLIITTNKQSYLPGEIATIGASVSEIVPLESLKFEVIAPNGKQVAKGNLFPDLTGSFASSLRDKDVIDPNSQFYTTLYIDNISPQFGTHKIIGQYGELAAETSFEVSQDIKEDKKISLTTDKKAYGLGETVIISGRLNNVWIPTLDLEVLQTSNLALTSKDLGAGGRNFKVLDAVRLEGDGTFKYQTKIPSSTSAYGDYRVTVSKDVGSAIVFFRVLENPDAIVEETSKIFSVKTDKTTYELGETIVISGKIDQIVSSSQYYTSSVKISIKTSEGKEIITSASKPSSNKPGKILFSLTAVPDTFGNYRVRDTLTKSIYNEGTYVITATYADGIYKDSTTFSVIDPQNFDAPVSAWLDKEVYGLGEIVQLNGIVRTGLASTSGVNIVITKPDGDTDKFGTTLDNGRFSWTWKTPIAEKSQTVSNERSVIASNFGVYKLKASQPGNPGVQLFFKVSPNPEEDTLALQPITVTTEKPLYNAGEKLIISGTAQKRLQGTEGLVVQERVNIVVKSPTNKQIYESSVYLDTGGNFKSTFEMPVTIFKDGTYKVFATYLGKRAENVFEVTNNFIVESDQKISLILQTDKDEYYPGEVVQITARPTKMIFVETIDVGIPRQEQTSLNCGAFVCGKGVPITTLRPDPSGAFFHQHKIPDKSSSIGTYIVTVDTEFGTFKKEFKVVEKPPVIEETTIPKAVTEKVIEKFNRITESFVPISIQDKTIDEKAVSPRVIQGSLFTPSRGEESNVNLKVSTEDGMCVIGSEEDCLVSKSTRAPGEIYQTVEIDGIDYKIRYSGADVMLEKFTILPEGSEETLPEMTWNVEVLKDEQPSRLYYKISYVSLE